MGILRSYEINLGSNGRLVTPLKERMFGEDHIITSAREELPVICLSKWQFLKTFPRGEKPEVSDAYERKIGVDHRLDIARFNPSKELRFDVIEPGFYVIRPK